MTAAESEGGREGGREQHKQRDMRTLCLLFSLFFFLSSRDVSVQKLPAGSLTSEVAQPSYLVNIVAAVVDKTVAISRFLHRFRNQRETFGFICGFYIGTKSTYCPLPCND